MICRHYIPETPQLTRAGVKILQGKAAGSCELFRVVNNTNIHGTFPLVFIPLLASMSDDANWFSYNQIEFHLKDMLGFKPYISRINVFFQLIVHATNELSHYWPSVQQIAVSPHGKPAMWRLGLYHVWTIPPPLVTTNMLAQSPMHGYPWRESVISQRSRHY